MKLSIKDLDLKGQRVFIRVDFNVPLKNGVIGDDTRIKSSLPTIQYALDAGRDRRPGAAISDGRRASRIPRSACGRSPIGSRSSSASRSPSPPTASATPAQQAATGDVVLLENLRFHPEEEKNDAGVRRRTLARSRRATSTTRSAPRTARTRRSKAITHSVERPAAGLLMEKELQYLGHALESPGAAVRRDPRRRQGLGQDRRDPEHARQGRPPVIGGAMAYTFFKSRGVPVGQVAGRGRQARRRRHD